MATAPKKVKWALGGDEPDDLQEFLSNEDILKKHTKRGEVQWPGKGPFRFKVKRLTVKPNKNGDPRISAMVVLDEPKGSDAASWNGYLIWEGFNIVEGPSLSFVKRFLKGLGLTWDDFLNRTKQDSQDPPHLVQIGGVKFEGAKDPTVMATVVVKPADDYNDDEHWEIGRYIPVEDVTEDEDEDDDEDDDGVAVLDDDPEDADDAADDEEADEDSEAEDDDDEWSREDLENEDFDTIVQVAKDDFGLKAKDVKPFLKDEDADGLLDLLFPDEDGDAEDEPDEDAIEELRAELKPLKVVVLRKRALKNDADADLTDLKKDDLIGLILQQELNAPPF